VCLSELNQIPLCFPEKLKAATAACTAAVSAGNKNNQDALLEAGALE
jgi:hypothetical protein